MDPRGTVLLEGVLHAKWPRTLNFLWSIRRFSVCSDFSFRRYNGDDLRHSSIITPGASVSKVGSTKFTISFNQRDSDVRYHMRAASSAERDMWVAFLYEITSFLTA
jgi:hypothetical protein